MHRELALGQTSWKDSALTSSLAKVARYPTECGIRAGDQVEPRHGRIQLEVLC